MKIIEWQNGLYHRMLVRSLERRHMSLRQVTLGASAILLLCAQSSGLYYMAPWVDKYPATVIPISIAIVLVGLTVLGLWCRIAFHGIMHLKTSYHAFGMSAVPDHLDLGVLTLASVSGKKNRSLSAVYKVMGTEHALACMKLRTLLRSSGSKPSPEVIAYAEYVERTLRKAADGTSIKSLIQKPDAVMQSASLLVSPLLPTCLDAPIASKSLHGPDVGIRQAADDDKMMKDLIAGASVASVKRPQ